MALCAWCRLVDGEVCALCGHCVCTPCVHEVHGCPCCGEHNFDYCLECGARLPDDDEVLQEVLWEEDDDEVTPLGPCCICDVEDTTVRHILLLPHAGALPGRGWGCLTCALPPLGVTAVLCNECFAEYVRGRTRLKYWCAGHPATDGRRDIADLPPPRFEHDLRRHAEPPY